jgi:hypothetical protein
MTKTTPMRAKNLDSSIPPERSVILAWWFSTGAKVPLGGMHVSNAWAHVFVISLGQGMDGI